MGLVYRGLARMLLDNLQNPNPRETTLYRDLKPCYICALAAPSRRNAVRELPRELRRAEFREQYLRSDGVCVWHAAETLPLAGRTEAAVILGRLDGGEARWEALAGLPPDVALPVGEVPLPECQMCKLAMAAVQESLTRGEQHYCRSHAQLITAREQWVGSNWNSAVEWLHATVRRPMLWRLGQHRVSLPGCGACDAICRAENAPCWLANNRYRPDASGTSASNSALDGEPCWPASTRRSSNRFGS